MSKKKDEKDEGKRSLLGRPGNNVSIGIVGMPNVGKSTLFNILSKLHVPAENYPFCTKEPNTAKVEVPDARFDHLVNFWKPKSVIRAVLTITDIAGLVKGAHEGKGLGNEFLSNISATDALFHVCRAFADKDIEHVEGTVDPIRDLSIISDELLLKDKAMVKARYEVVKRIVDKGMDKTKKSATELAVITKVLAHLEEGKDVRGGTWGNNEIDTLNELQCLTAKPVVYLVNISQKNFEEQKNKWLKDINEWVKKRSPGSIVIPFSCPFENYLSSMEDEEKKKDYLKEKKVISMISKIIKTGYAALECIYFFTSGTDEVRAWTIRKGALAPQAAGVIHTDFEKGFISCETMSFEDFKSKGSEAACKAAGRYRAEGKSYVVADGDICFFKFGTSEKVKKK